MAEAAPSEERQQLLRKVIPNETVLALRHTSDLQGVLQTLFTVGTLVVGASLVFLSRGNLLALLVLGFFVSFLFMPLHECVHRTAFKSAFANDSVAFVTGVLTLRPPVHYKRYHNAHHRFTGDPDKDPELSDSWVDPSLKTFPSYCLYLSGLMFWIDRVMTVVKHACGIVQEFYLSSFHDEIVSEARLFLGIYFCLGCLGLTNPGVARVLMLYWIIPSFLGQPFLRFYLIAEHNGCKQGVDMMGNTRTTLTHWFYRKLAWNMPYHAEHHAWPYVPFHALGKLHELVKSSTVKKNGCQPAGNLGYIGINSILVDKLLHGKSN